MTDSPSLKVVEPAIDELLNNATSAGEKVFHGFCPQNTEAPYIIYQEVGGGERFRSINNPSGIAQDIIQVDVYHKGPLDAKKLSAKVEYILDGFKGVVYYGADSPQDDVNIAGISLQTAAENVDNPDNPLIFRSRSTFLTTYHQL